MSGWEYLFTFYSLLLGLAVANTTNNLAEMWRSHRAVAVGLATPLLCLFILLAVAQQWVSFWGARETLTLTPNDVLMGLAMALPYIFVSHGMIPAREGSGSFEEFYIEHRRTLMGVLAVPPVLSALYNIAKFGFGEAHEAALGLGLVVLPRVLIPLGLAFTRSPRLHVIGLTVLIAHTLWRLYL
jgi:hypothetical protein